MIETTEEAETIDQLQDLKKSLLIKKVPLKEKVLEINFTIQLIDSAHLKNPLLN